MTIEYRMLCISTGHLPQADRLLLQSHIEMISEGSEVDRHAWYETKLPGGFAVPMYGGWLLRIFDEDLVDDSDTVFPAYSRNLSRLMNVCRAEGYGWLRLDRDADEHPELPIFSD